VPTQSPGKLLSKGAKLRPIAPVSQSVCGPSDLAASSALSDRCARPQENSRRSIASAVAAARGRSPGSQSPVGAAQASAGSWARPLCHRRQLELDCQAINLLRRSLPGCPRRVRPRQVPASATSTALPPPHACRRQALPIQPRPRSTRARRHRDQRHAGLVKSAP